MNNLIKSEILEIHKLFQSWYNGSLKKSDLDSIIGNRLAEDFYIVFPDATKHTKHGLLKIMKKDHGNDKDYKIEIKNINIIALSASTFIANYEELQYWGSSKEPKLKLRSTSVLRISNNKPEWFAIHETKIK